MIYNFWKNYEELLSYDQSLSFDYRLDNIAIKLNEFFQRLIIKKLAKKYKVLFSWVMYKVRYF